MLVVVVGFGCCCVLVVVWLLDIFRFKMAAIFFFQMAAIFKIAIIIKIVFRIFCFFQPRNYGGTTFSATCEVKKFKFLIS